MNSITTMTVDDSDMNAPGETLWELKQRCIAYHRREMRKALWRIRFVKAYRIRQEIKWLKSVTKNPV